MYTYYIIVLPFGVQQRVRVIIITIDHQRRSPRQSIITFSLLQYTTQATAIGYEYGERVHYVDTAWVCCP